jgi:hypothetical protein
MKQEYYATFLGKHGYDLQLKKALDLLEVGKKYKVIGGDYGAFSTTYILEDFPKDRFNSVMFDADLGVESILFHSYAEYYR